MSELRNRLAKVDANAPASRTYVKKMGFIPPVETGVTVVLAVLVAWLSLNFLDFRSGANFSVILSGVAEIGIVAAGMTLVIATGGIDISVGSVVGLCGIVFATMVVQYHWSLMAATVLTLIVGSACGLLNGLLIARFKLPPIIATLATFSAARAGAYIFSQGNSISGLPEQMTNFGFGSWLGVPQTVWLAAAVLLATGILVRKTRFGRSVLALGGSREASFLSGISTRKVEIGVYILSGLLAAVSALVVISRQATADPNAGKFFEMRAITAVVVGGTPVIGGQATILGTALGVILSGVVQNGVIQYKKDAMWEMLVTALVLLAAVEVDRIRRAALLRKSRSV